MRVFVTGVTGLIGRRLAERLVAHGDDVTGLTRSADRARPLVPASVRILEGDPTQPGAWQDSLAACEAVVHLAGEPVMGRRWSAERKALLTRSRVDGTRNVAEACSRGGAQVRVLVAGSAIGYYGATGEREVDEHAPAGSDFLAELCVAWEREAGYAASEQRRVVQLRIGVVLDPAGGALQRMLTPFKAFAGGRLGEPISVVDPSRRSRRALAPGARRRARVRPDQRHRAHARHHARAVEGGRPGAASPVVAAGAHLRRPAGVWRIGFDVPRQPEGLAETRR